MPISECPNCGTGCWECGARTRSMGLDDEELARRALEIFAAAEIVVNLMYMRAAADVSPTRLGGYAKVFAAIREDIVIWVAETRLAAEARQRQP